MCIDAHFWKAIGEKVSNKWKFINTIEPVILPLKVFYRHTTQATNALYTKYFYYFILVYPWDRKLPLAESNSWSGPSWDQSVTSTPSRLGSEYVGPRFNWDGSRQCTTVSLTRIDYQTYEIRTWCLRILSQEGRCQLLLEGTLEMGGMNLAL